MTDACRVEGRCTTRGGRCVAGSDYECWASENCRTDGRCTLEPDESACDEGLERANPALFATGIVLAGHGAFTTVGGLVWLLPSVLAPAGSTERIGAAVMVSGGALLALAVGLPMALVGRCPVPRQPSWRMRTGSFELRADGATLSF